MDVMEKIYDRAKSKPQRVIFPEATEDKILMAAYQASQMGFCIPTLIGTPEDIKAAAAKYGVDISGMTIIDNNDEAMKEAAFEKYRANYSDMLSLKALKRKSKDPMYTAMVLECNGDFDVTFSGFAHTTGDVILAATTIIGLQEGIDTPSSTGLLISPTYEGSEGNALIFGDSAVCTNPTPAERASIAISACETAIGLLGWEPRCALLSFSTDGSMEGDMVDSIRESVKIANERRPDLKIDGEFQLDAAITPKGAAKKVKRESEVAGKANIIIWPDINVGNIGVKLTQIFGNCNCPGPFLQGFKKIASDCSRSAPVEELVGNVAMCCCRSANQK